jgi:hypothetical protein
MLNSTHSIFTFIAFVCLMSIGVHTSAQSGLVLQGGLYSMFSPDPNVTKEGQGHYGWTAGVEARLLDGGLFFIMGGRYTKTTLLSTSSIDPFSGRKVAVTDGRFGVGFIVFRLSERVYLRSKILCNINFLGSTDEKNPTPGYEKINDSFLGATSGIGLTIRNLEFDLDYQHGFLNAYTGQKESTFNTISLVGGIRF